MSACVSVLHQFCRRLRRASHCARTLARTLSGSVGALRLANRLRSGICLASVLPMPAACPLKCHALKRCTFWRETCLASAIALRLVNQRARAANQRARTANRLRSDICLSSALHALPLCTRCDKDIIIQINELDNQFERIFLWRRLEAIGKL